MTTVSNLVEHDMFVAVDDGENGLFRYLGGGAAIRYVTLDGFDVSKITDLTISPVIAKGRTFPEAYPVTKISFY